MGRKPSLKKLIDRAKERASAAEDGIKPGRVIGERYEVVRELGAGAFGAVFLATDRQGSERVAIKVLHDHMVSAEAMERMQREANALRQLDGTCAVGVRDFAQTDDGHLVLVMEYLDGQNLGEMVEAYERGGNRMTLHEIGITLRPIVDTLRVAHERHIVHRDLKPENIFVLRANVTQRTRLLDFGLVKDLNLEKLTAAGTIAGSPAYIAPEAWEGRPELLDHRIDVYALGAVVYRLLIGRTPFADATDMLQLMTAVTQGPRPRPCAFRPDLPRAADAWAERALAIHPENRYQTVQELWDALGYVVSLTAV